MQRPEPVSTRHVSGSLLENGDYRVFATTVLRGSTNHDLTGYLVEIDWKSGSVERRIPIPIDTGHPFWNERGGNRGGRGVWIHDDTLYVATAMSVLTYDSKLNQTGEITHPHLAGVHEICVVDGGIWFTSTVHDLVLKTDFDGNVLDEFWGSESPLLQDYFGFSSRSLNLELNFPADSFEDAYEAYCNDERLHVNTVQVVDGAVYVLANKRNALIRIRPTPERIVFQDPQLASPHNSVIQSDGRVLVNNTRKQTLCIYDLEAGELQRIIETNLSHTDEPSEQFAKAGWQRGLAAPERNVCLVGTSPAAIFEVDVSRGLLGRVVTLDDDVRHCIHGLVAARDF
jgi:hypothetical protein